MAKLQSDDLTLDVKFSSFEDEFWLSSSFNFIWVAHDSPSRIT